MDYKQQYINVDNYGDDMEQKYTKTDNYGYCSPMRLDTIRRVTSNHGSINMVSGRQLHQLLGFTGKFKSWIKNIIAEHDLIIDAEYRIFTSGPKKDYYVAKHVANYLISTYAPDNHHLSDSVRYSLLMSEKISKAKNLNAGAADMLWRSVLRGDDGSTFKLSDHFVCGECTISARELYRALNASEPFSVWLDSVAPKRHEYVTAQNDLFITINLAVRLASSTQTNRRAAVLNALKHL